MTTNENRTVAPYSDLCEKHSSLSITNLIPNTSPMFAVRITIKTAAIAIEDIRIWKKRKQFSSRKQHLKFWLQIMDCNWELKEQQISNWFTFESFRILRWNTDTMRMEQKSEHTTKVETSFTQLQQEVVSCSYVWRFYVSTSRKFARLGL